MMLPNETLSTYDPIFQSKVLWLLMYLSFSPAWGFLVCLTSNQNIYSPSPFKCTVSCLYFLIAFSGSLITKAGHLLSVTVALCIYFIAFWCCNCNHCQSARSKSPSRLKSLSSCPQKLIYWKTEKGG